MTQLTPEQRRDADIPTIRGRLAEMRGEYAADLASGNLDRESDEYSSAHRAFLQEVNDLDTYLTLRLNEQRAVMPAALLEGVPSGVLADASRREERSPGRIVVENEAFRAWCRENAGREKLVSRSPEISLEAILGRDVEFRATLETAGTMAPFLPVQQPRPPVINQQRLFVRDLLTVVPTSASHIPYMREVPATNQGGAQTVAEGADKPEVSLEVVEDDAKVQVIAGWIKISTQLLEDAPAIQAWINTKLVYKLKFAEEAQILSGNGTNPNLKGIRAFSDVQDQAFTVDTATTLGQAMAKIEIANGQATGVAMNPVDAWNLLTHRAAGGSGEFDYANPWAPAMMPQATIWGLPIVRTKSIESGVALVGDYANAAMLHDRKQAGVRVYDQYADLPTKNQVLLLAEERVALSVDTPSHFCEAATHA